MKSYALIDLHCDTLTDYLKKADTENPNALDDPERFLSLLAIPSYVRRAQFFAIFVPDVKKRAGAIKYYKGTVSA